MTESQYLQQLLGSLQLQLVKLSAERDALAAELEQLRAPATAPPTDERAT